MYHEGYEFESFPSALFPMLNADPTTHPQRTTHNPPLLCPSPKMLAKITMNRGPRTARRWLPGGSEWRVPKRTRSTGPRGDGGVRERPGAQPRAASADIIGRTPIQRLVRGVAKVKAIALWYAIAHNLRRAVSLRAALAVQA